MAERGPEPTAAEHPADAKTALRRAARARRRDLVGRESGADRDQHADRLAAHLRPLLVELPAHSTVASFTSLPTEPPTASLNAQVRALGHRLLLPVLLPDKDLDWQQEDGDVLGLSEIASAALVFVPALIVGRDGSRLGQGGGSYDRALARVGAQAELVAVVHDHEVVASVPRDDHDRDVDAVVTATSGLVRLSPRVRPPG